MQFSYFTAFFMASDFAAALPAGGVAVVARDSTNIARDGKQSCLVRMVLRGLTVRFCAAFSNAVIREYQIF